MPQTMETAQGDDGNLDNSANWEVPTQRQKCTAALKKNGVPDKGWPSKVP